MWIRRRTEQFDYMTRFIWQQKVPEPVLVLRSVFINWKVKRFEMHLYMKYSTE